MEVGISTASLFCRMTTEDALKYLSQNKVSSVEVFLSTYYEYQKKFAKTLSKVKGETSVHSIHTLNTQFEPQLYSVNSRAEKDAFDMLKNVLFVGKKIGAKNYTFHGLARVKRTPYNYDLDKVGLTTQKIIDECSKNGITLCYENVHWAIYNYAGFFKQMKKRCPALKATLDIKQAYQSGVSVYDYIDDMQGNINTVHLTDRDADGKLCLPGKGCYDYLSLFKALKDAGFDGSVIVEVYKGDYETPTQLLACQDFIKEIIYKIF